MLDSKSIVEVSMALYKRNQVEEAIAKIVENSTKPSSVLRTRLKRLLEADRANVPRSGKKEHFAFFSTKAPGRGNNVWFSDYEAFALFVALVLLQNRWPQRFCVRVLREARQDLEREYLRIIAQDPKELFDAKAIEAKAQPGDPYVENTDPVFLVIAAELPRPHQTLQNRICAVCRGVQEVFRVAKQMKLQSYSTYEIVNKAHKLKSQLSAIPPRKRGG